MKLNNRIEILEISTTIMGKIETIYPTLMLDDDNIILVDTGFPGQLQEFQQAIDETGIPFDNINKIIITHHDIDHIGSLSNILGAIPQRIEVLSHEEEAAFIQGDRKAIKLMALEAQLDSMPEQMKPIYEGFKRFYSGNKSKVDRTVTDGEILPYCGGVTVIHTPGHTPGHICLYHNQSKTLLAGDMLSVKDGVLIKASSFTNHDNAAAQNSIEKLAQYDIETVICYHGGIYKANVNHRILELAKQQ